MHIKNFLIVILAGLLIACSEDDSGSGSGDHVWKDQVDTMDRAREAEQKMLEAVELKKQAVEEQSR